MKRIIFTLVMVAVLLVACTPSRTTCVSTFDDVFPDGANRLTIGMLMSTDWPNGTKGALLKECFEKDVISLDWEGG